MTKAQKRWALGPDEAGHQALFGYGARERSLPSPGSPPHAPSLPPPSQSPLEAGSWSEMWRPDPPQETGGSSPRERDEDPAEVLTAQPGKEGWEPLTL